MPTGNHSHPAETADSGIEHHVPELIVIRGPGIVRNASLPLEPVGLTVVGSRAETG
ncbi:hypothetical protein [Skermania sp. ID1734]|uniref:hypothetical protein n=1 Tax=Skermania sp. ID1734 TaxID=2597516 RepID=UPI00163D541D|nr:hypothetical protein [Skermania sp. ID1734]